MLCFSKSTGYAIRALACADALRPRLARTREVARCTGIPRSYLARLLSRLARQGIVSTKRGQHGGISLGRPAGEVSLLEVVTAVEGREWIGPCILGMADCGNGLACPLRRFWGRIREEIEAKLRQLTLADVLAVMGNRLGRGGRHRRAGSRRRRT